MCAKRMTKRADAKKPSPTPVEIESPKVLEEATGTVQPHLQQRLMNQIWETLWKPDDLSEADREARIRSAMDVLRGIRPKDEIEGLLATQMVATHNAAMECLRRAMIPQQSVEGRDQNLKHAVKLLAIYARQIETLNKHRGKGQQKVTVEHVNVEAGGQAMVGHFETGKQPSKRKRRAKNSPKAIPHDPGEILDIGIETEKPANLRKR